MANRELHIPIGDSLLAMTERRMEITQCRSTLRENERRHVLLRAAVQKWLVDVLGVFAPRYVDVSLGQRKNEPRVLNVGVEWFEHSNRFVVLPAPVISHPQS